MFVNIQADDHRGFPLSCLATTDRFQEKRAEIQVMGVLGGISNTRLMDYRIALGKAWTEKAIPEEAALSAYLRRIAQATNELSAMPEFRDAFLSRVRTLDDMLPENEELVPADVVMMCTNVGRRAILAAADQAGLPMKPVTQEEVDVLPVAHMAARALERPRERMTVGYSSRNQMMDTFLLMFRNAVPAAEGQVFASSGNVREEAERMIRGIAVALERPVAPDADIDAVTSSLMEVTTIEELAHKVMRLVRPAAISRMRSEWAARREAEERMGLGWIGRHRLVPYPGLPELA